MIPPSFPPPLKIFPENDGGAAVDGQSFQKDAFSIFAGLMYRQSKRSGEENIKSLERKRNA